ncbi:MAG: TIGR01777 family oxidoreductase [Gammaproteobacteria bacterium]|nr:TIGR01777 family oxidoreductase [Gammaproteobacteria bacterium]MBU2056192.1 TIGR01777 family oxidoreductase [Gammaproteobacteria bacterium]MBU2176943.1 TIGR01777 family oxidoreductase [Gammaproteobacteria bacterium]MBU2248951.1 TIGR01777 family oxidoreductase [Gammaproteobacteria bacterium]MBU2344893.1 TIGR01777 family oxidoreductase [Gammaproteobacteria bacterium]
MKILITGATGLIGRALIAGWQGQHQLSVLSRSSAKARETLGIEADYQQSLDDFDFNRIDAVINLAGEPIADKRWSESQKQNICQSRWQLTEALAEKIQHATTPPKVLINGSAIGFYGRQGSEIVTEEQSSFYPEFSHDICARWENLAQRAASPQTRVCLLRTGIVLSSQGGALAKMMPLFKLGLGGPIGDGKQMMSWIHLDDMVRLISFLLQRDDLSGPFNATAPRPVSNKQFSQLLAERFGKKAPFTVPAFVLRLVFGEMADLLLFGQNVQPKRLLDHGFQFNHSHLKDALNALQL